MRIFFVVDIVDLIALHKLHQILTQGIVAVRGGVLNRLAALLVKNLVGDAAQILQREKSSLLGRPPAKDTT